MLKSRIYGTHKNSNSKEANLYVYIFKLDVQICRYIIKTASKITKTQKKTLKVVFLSAEVGVNAATWYIFQAQAKNQEFFAEKKFHIFSHLEKKIIFQDKDQLSLFT